MDDLTLGKMLTEAYREQVDYFVQEGVSVSQLSLSVRFDRSGQLDGERMVDRSGQPDECNSSKAQIRTLLDEQRQMIIAEYCEKVSHHELQAAQAEEERRLLQGQLWRQKLEFREAHQLSLTEMEELRKFQSSTFDTIARRKLIEDQNTILELSGRVQELQNEVNCMNDSKDFQDAESVRSGNSHVTSRPVSFPPHPIPGGMLRHSFVSPRRKERPPSIWDTHGISGNVFAASSSHEVSLEPIFKRREDLGKHSVYTHFPNLSDNCESRNNHRHAVVVQDPATQWIQAYPCKTKTSQETQRSLQKVPGTCEESKSH